MIKNIIETFYCFEAITNDNCKIRFSISKEKYEYLNTLDKNNDKLNYLNKLYDRGEFEFTQFIKTFSSNNGDIRIGCIEKNGSFVFPELF